jgi:hypothetical protein
MLSQPSTVGATSETQVSAIQGLIAPDTLQHADVRPPLSPAAGLLAIEPTPLTTPTVPGIACGTAECAGTREVVMSPEGAV